MEFMIKGTSASVSVPSQCVRQVAPLPPETGGLGRGPQRTAAASLAAPPRAAASRRRPPRQAQGGGGLLSRGPPAAPALTLALAFALAPPSRFLLVIHFIHISVYISIPISQFIPPPPHLPLPPLGVHTFVFYICVSISALQTGSSVPFF